jgi:DMSO/TMAO reductase YedYZ molybdopterin-dependent catalytic subunit
MVRDPLRTGALLGLLLTLPLTAVMDLASAATSVRFPPFDMFEWLTRILPGGMVIFGIDALVAVLGGLGLSLRTTAKTAEQGLALAFFVAGGVVAGLMLGGWFRLARGRDPLPRSLVVAGVVGLVIADLVPASAPATGAPGSPATVAWVVALFLLWGGLFGLTWRRLGGLGKVWSEEGRQVRSDPEPPLAPGPGPEPAMFAGIQSPEVMRTSDRREFLVRIGGAAAVITVGGAGLAQLLRPTLSEAATIAQPQVLPSRVGAIVPAPGTRPEITPVKDHYRIDIDLIPPSVDGRKWNLPITGLVEKPARLTLDGFEKGAYGEPQHLFITLECISNPIGGELISTTRWTGVPLRAVLQPLGPKPAARYASVRAKDGFHEIVPLDLAMGDQRVMLTYQWDGRPLPREHGYPLRIYIPDRYGMKQPKWITSIELTDRYEPGYWVERGWSQTAQVRTTSVIDTVAVKSVYERDGKKFVPVGGIAYAGARGISRVQVKVDEGQWTDAVVGQPLSGLTWVIWRYDWPFESGSHTFAVRAFDGLGELQVEKDQPPEPAGATGIYKVKKRI